MGYEIGVHVSCHMQLERSLCGVSRVALGLGLSVGWVLVTLVWANDNTLSNEPLALSDAAQPCATVEGYSCSTIWALLGCHRELHATYQYLANYSRDAALGADVTLDRPDNLMTVFVTASRYTRIKPSSLPDDGTLNPRNVSISMLYSSVPGNFSREDLVEQKWVDTVLGYLTGDKVPLRFEYYSGQVMVFSGGDSPAMISDSLFACNGVIHLLDEDLEWNPSYALEQEVQLLDVGSWPKLGAFNYTADCGRTVNDMLNDLSREMEDRVGSATLFSVLQQQLQTSGLLLLEGLSFTWFIPLNYNVSSDPPDFQNAALSSDSWDPSLMFASHMLLGSYCPLQLLAQKSVNTMLGAMTGTNVTLSFSQNSAAQVLVSTTEEQPSRNGSATAALLDNTTSLHSATILESFTVCQSVIYFIDKALVRPEVLPVAKTPKASDLFPILTDLTSSMRRIPSKCENLLPIPEAISSPYPASDAVLDSTLFTVLNCTLNTAVPIPVNASRALAQAMMKALNDGTELDPGSDFTIQVPQINVPPYYPEHGEVMVISAVVAVSVNGTHTQIVEDYMQTSVNDGEFAQLLNQQGVPASDVTMVRIASTYDDADTESSTMIGIYPPPGPPCTSSSGSHCDSDEPPASPFNVPGFSQLKPTTPPPSPSDNSGAVVALAVSLSIAIPLALLLTVIGAVLYVRHRSARRVSESSKHCADLKEIRDCAPEDVYQVGSNACVSGMSRPMQTDDSESSRRSDSIITLSWHNPVAALALDNGAQNEPFMGSSLPQPSLKQDSALPTLKSDTILTPDFGLSSPQPSGLGNTVKVEPTGKCRDALHDLLNAVEASWLIQHNQLTFTRKIGTGSFGDVHLGEWRGTPVAIKSIPIEEHGEGDSMQLLCALKALQKEMYILAQCRHPNIVLFLGVCVSPLCCITEFCARGSLYNLFKRCHTEAAVVQQLTWHRRLSMALDAAMGMSFLHSRSPPVVHRDLKSPNLLVDKNWKVKVADFGLSYIVDPAVVASTLVAMNPRWLAPEVVTSACFSTASDAYSFGIIMWELLTLQTPFPNIPTFRILYMVAQGSHPSIPNEFDIPDGTFPGMSEYIELMQHCWSHEPSKRPGFEEILSRLRDILRGYERWLAASRSQRRLRPSLSMTSASSPVQPLILQDSTEGASHSLDQEQSEPLATPESLTQ